MFTETLTQALSIQDVINTQSINGATVYSVKQIDMSTVKRAIYLFQGGSNAHNVERLVRAAKDPSRLHIRWFADESGAPVVGNGLGASHSKWASADGSVMVLGSQNLDTQSWKRSRELGVAVDDPKTTREFDAVFDRVFARGAVAYEPARR